MGARVVLSLDDEILSEVALDKPVTVVGRHPACDIVIDHPAVSGRHLLFRIVNTTVYVEDLASTNGTKVNGLPANHQVAHHLDMIEVGHHKLHFFDEALLSGGVSNLENTVLTDYERTMMAQHAPAEAAAEAAQRKLAAMPADDELSRTMAIPRDPSVRLGPAQEAVRTGGHAPLSAQLALRVLSGERRGEIISLLQANTMIGDAGGQNALVVRRGVSYFLARFGSARMPRLNRADLGPGTHSIAPNDLIEVGGSSYEVIQLT